MGRFLFWLFLSLPLWAKSDGLTITAKLICPQLQDLSAKNPDDLDNELPKDMPISEVISRTSAYLAPDPQKYFEIPRLGSGATSQAYLVGKNVVLMPITGNLLRTQKEYRKVMRIYDLIHDLPKEKRRAFPELIDAHTYIDLKNSRDMLALVFERANRGTLTDNLQNPKIGGPYASFATLVKSALRIMDSIATLNSLTDPNLPATHGSQPLAHGDVKPANFLVTNRGQGLEILASDIGSHDVEDPHGTALYLPIKNSPFTPRTILRPIALDAWAARKVLQELLMGMLIRNLPPELVLRGRLADQFLSYEGAELKKSPYSINKRISPILSAISWAPDPSPASIATSLRKATEYEKSPAKFFKEYFGPQVLMKLSAQQVAASIFYADELKRMFDPKDLTASRTRLGLSAGMMVTVASRIAEFEKAENPEVYKNVNPDAPTQVHVPAATP